MTHRLHVVMAFLALLILSAGGIAVGATDAGNSPTTGATTVPEEAAPHATTLQQAQSAVGFTLHTPSYLPAGARFVSVSVFPPPPGGAKTLTVVVLFYKGPGWSLQVWQTAAVYSLAGPGVSSIRIGGTPGQLQVWGRPTRPAATVVVRRAGVTYQVFGFDLSPQEVERVEASLLSPRRPEDGQDDLREGASVEVTRQRSDDCSSRGCERP
jgi:hypothetical protein